MRMGCFLDFEKVWFWACTLPQTNIAPENGWLAYYFPFGFRPIFRGELLVSGRVSAEEITRNQSMKAARYASSGHPISPAARQLWAFWRRPRIFTGRCEWLISGVHFKPFSCHPAEWKKCRKKGTKMYFTYVDCRLMIIQVDGKSILS